ncbi:MAG: RluA family pseudouridine synthase [Planctomycetota bacterium]
MVKESYKERHCRIKIREKMAGRRIDSYLAARFQGYSRSFFQKLISSGGVLLDGRPVKNSTSLRPGSEIVLTLPAVEKNILPEEISLDIIYEDKWILAVNKSPNVVVHPARGNFTGTIINALFGRYRNEIETIDGFYPKVVHRLDKNTSGLLLIGLYEEEHAKLATQFEFRKVCKLYRAIVHGVVEHDEGEIDLPIGESEEDESVMAIRPDIGKPSLTVFKVIRRFRNFSLVELELKTGRTHQIRVHMAAIGHPLACDEDYGGGGAIFPQDVLGDEFESLEPVLDRQALHSASIEFSHPVTWERMKLEAPMASDMEAFLKLLERAGG